jgi:cell division septation protein DedD
MIHSKRQYTGTGSFHGFFAVLLFLILTGLCPAPYLTAEENSSQWQALDTNARIEWLAEHLEDSRFFERLIETLEGVEEPDRGVSLLNRFLPVIEEHERRYRVLLRLARLEESVGELESAQTHYQSAASARRGEWDFKALFSSAMLLVELGDYSLAELQLTRIADRTDSTPLRQRARVHLARLKILDDDEASARNIIEELSVDESFSPSILYLIYTLSLHLELRERAVDVKERLVKEYPRSPEAGMVQGVVDRAPSIEKVFGLLHVSEKVSPGAEESRPEQTAGTPEKQGDMEAESAESAESADTADAADAAESTGEESADTGSEEVARSIQTGSFRDEENARYMVKELKTYGFSAEIQEAELSGTVYHRVVVPVESNDTAQQIMIRLKEHGYEGYPLY